MRNPMCLAKIVGVECKSGKPNLICVEVVEINIHFPDIPTCVAAVSSYHLCVSAKTDICSEADTPVA